MWPTTIPAIALYDARAIAGMVWYGWILLFYLCWSLSSFFVLPGTETGRSRRRSGRGRRRAELKSELTDCKQNQCNLFVGYIVHDTCIPQIDYIVFFNLDLPLIVILEMLFPSLNYELYPSHLLCYQSTTKPHHIKVRNHSKILDFPILGPEGAGDFINKSMSY